MIREEKCSKFCWSRSYETILEKNHDLAIEYRSWTSSFSNAEGQERREYYFILNILGRAIYDAMFAILLAIFMVD